MEDQKLIDNINLDRTGLVITERCNLKCKLCGEFAPLYKNPPQPSYGMITKTIDRYFDCVDHVGDFSLFGGEPLLHPDFYQIVEYLEKYSDRMDRLLILTNGTILPPSEKILKLKRSLNVAQKLCFNISDYGPALSRKVEALKTMLDDQNIMYRIIKYWGDDIFCNGWVDFGDNSLKYFTKEDAIEHASKCTFRKGQYFSLRIHNGDSWLGRCGRSFWRMYIGVLSPDTTDLVRMMALPREQVREQIVRLINSNVSESCAYCNGQCEDSPRFKPAEQIEK